MLTEDNFKDINELTHAEMAGEEIEQVINKKEPVQTPEKVEQKMVKQKKASSTKKTTKKKTTKKNGSKKKTPKTIIVDEETSGDKWLTIIVSAIAVLAIILGIYFIFTSVSGPEEANTVEAVVNGVPIYDTDVDIRMKIIQNTENPTITRAQALNGTINQQLLIQEAEKQGIKVSDAEVTETLEASLISNGLSMEEFEESLAENGLESEAVLDFYKSNLLTFRLINKSVLSKIMITDEDAEEYFNDNQESFETPERVTVKHNLIGFNEETENDTLAEAEDVLADLDDDKGNFCDLVKEFSDDLGSKDTCGEYTFTREDLLVPEFLEAGFDMSEDEVRIVKTQFGYHIMWKIADLPAGVLEFDDVKESIKNLLTQQTSLEKYSELVSDLREQAIIEIYTDTGEEIPEQPLIPDNEEEASVEEEISTQEDEPEVEIAEQPRKDVVKTEKSTLKNFAECVADSGAIMYTKYWAPDNEAQLDIFGEDADLIEVIECDPSSEDNKAEECEEFDFKTFPSWVIDDEVHQGVQSQMRLSTVTGCYY